MAGEEISRVEVVKTNNLPANSDRKVASGGGANAPQTFNYEVKSDGKGTSVASKTDFNLYGNNIENFDKFKGNDKNDAFNLTRSVAFDVKKAYMQLQHEYPEVILEFEPMPDPKTCGKKREGFFTYQQMLKEWKDAALTQIANRREQSTVELVQSAVGAVNQNTDEKAAMNAGVTVATGEAIVEAVNKNTDEKAADINANVDREGAATRKAVHGEGAATRRAVHAEGAATREAVAIEGSMTRDAVHFEGVRTRNEVREQGAETRNTVRKESTKTRNLVREEGAQTRETNRQTAQETQELESLSNKISDVLTNHDLHTNKTIRDVEGIRDQILNSSIPHEEKKELLNNLARWADQYVLSDLEIIKKRTEIETRLVENNQKTSEASSKEEEPERVTPEYEKDIPSRKNVKPEKNPASAHPKKEPGLSNDKSNPFDKKVKK